MVGDWLSVARERKASVLMLMPPPGPEGGKDKDAPSARDLLDFEDDRDDGSFPLASVFRDVAVLHILTKFMVAIEERGVNLPVGNVVTFFEHMRVVDEYPIFIEQAHDIFL